MSKKLVSIVISAYNEEGNIYKLYDELSKVIDDFNDLNFEIIFVNDGSKDDTLNKIKSLQEKFSKIKIVSFTRNFGHEIAMTAGMDYSHGDCVIFMDADLQHPPVYIKSMIEKWKNGSQIVLTKRFDNRDSSKIYKIFSSVFYKILNFLSDVKIPEKSPDFRLLDRKYIDFLKNFNERDRMFRGLLNLIVDVDSVEFIKFIAPARFSGKTKYNFFKSLRLALNALTQFSTRPLRLSIYLGLIVGLMSACLGFYVLFERIINYRPIPGYATIVCAITFIGSVQLLVLGIIGEYIGKIHMEVKRRPLYFAEIIDGGKGVKTDNN